MRFSKFWILIFCGALLLNSCSSDDDNGGGTSPDNPGQTEAAYSHGFFVTNEGQFPNPGSIAFIGNELDTVESHILQTVNGDNPGSVVQSMFFDDNGHAYIIANNSNMITIVDRYTFEKTGIIDQGLEAPRYGVVVNGKAYVTNQVDFNDTDTYVAVINLQSMTVEDSINLGTETAEHIAKGNSGKIYVQNGSAFSDDHEVSIIDPTTNTVVNTVSTDEGLNSIATANGLLYTLTGDDLEIFTLNGGTVKDIDLNYAGSPANLTLAGNTIYFTVGNAVYTMSADADAAPTSALFDYTTSSQFGAMYGFAVHNNQIYIADGGDFASASFIEVHDNNGDLIKKLTVGIGPNGFYFND